MPASTTEPTVGLVPMDNNIGMSNRLEKGDMEKMMIDTLSDLADVLKDHCGPYGKYAAITSPVNPSAEPIFTKDGINIIRSIDYVSQVQQFIRHTLMYMGSRIESTAGDGTTSAMIIMAVAMRELIQKIKDIPCTYQDLVTVYQKYILDVMEKDYKEYWGYHVDNEIFKQRIVASGEGATIRKRAIRYIAYSQAYTSSHGDVELSNIIADLFANTPKEVWHLFSLDKAAYETKDRYVVDTECCQWKVEGCQLFPLSQMTEEFGTAAVRTNATTLMVDHGISVGDDYTQALRDRIEQAIQNGEQLTILVTGNLDTATNMWLSGWFQKYPNHQISVYMVTPGDYGLWNDIPYMKVASGKQPSEVMEFQLDYKFNGKDLTITKGLYEDADTTTCHMHPFYKNEAYPLFNDFVDRLEHQIKVQSSVVATRESNKTVAHMKKMLSKLIVVNRNYFRVGGAAYDNAAAVDVAVDVLTSVKNTLINGCALGSNKSLYQFFYNLYKEACNSNDKTKIVRIQAAFAEAFMTAIEETFTAMFRFAPLLCPDDDKINQILLEPVPYNILEEEQSSSRYSSLYDMCFADDNVQPAILQPIDTDLAIVKRFGEVALRFVKTARLVSEGGIYLKHKES